MIRIISGMVGIMMEEIYRAIAKQCMLLKRQGG